MHGRQREKGLRSLKIAIFVFLIHDPQANEGKCAKGWSSEATVDQAGPTEPSTMVHPGQVGGCSDGQTKAGRKKRKPTRFEPLSTFLKRKKVKYAVREGEKWGETKSH